jgi:hypothetical protein
MMETTSVTIQLPASLHTELQALAAAENTDLIDVIIRLMAIVRRERVPDPPRASTPAFQQILEQATDLGITDLAEQHDHYLYGVEKQ